MVTHGALRPQPPPPPPLTTPMRARPRNDRIDAAKKIVQCSTPQPFFHLDVGKGGCGHLRSSQWGLGASVLRGKVSYLGIKTEILEPSVHFSVEKNYVFFSQIVDQPPRNMDSVRL